MCNVNLLEHQTVLIFVETRESVLCKSRFPTFFLWIKYWRFGRPHSNWRSARRASKRVPSEGCKRCGPRCFWPSKRPAAANSRRQQKLRKKKWRWEKLRLRWEKEKVSKKGEKKSRWRFVKVTFSKSFFVCFSFKSPVWRDFYLNLIFVSFDHFNPPLSIFVFDPRGSADHPAIGQRWTCRWRTVGATLAQALSEAVSLAFWQNVAV